MAKLRITIDADAFRLDWKLPNAPRAEDHEIRFLMHKPSGSYVGFTTRDDGTVADASGQVRGKWEVCDDDLLDSLLPAMFNHSEETGKIRAGIKYEYDGEGLAECYQFETVEELKDCARAYQAQPRMVRFEIVTHTGQYQNMRTVYKWCRDAA